MFEAGDELRIVEPTIEEADKTLDAFDITVIRQVLDNIWLRMEAVEQIREIGEDTLSGDPEHIP